MFTGILIDNCINTRISEGNIRADVGLEVINSHKTSATNVNFQTTKCAIKARHSSELFVKGCIDTSFKDTFPFKLSLIARLVRSEIYKF